MARTILLFALSIVAAVTDFPSQSKAQAQTDGHHHAVQKVLGIGGFFFRSHNPKQLASWYEQHLGVAPVPEAYGQSSWQQKAGPTAFAPFPENTKYFGDATKLWMIDFRVADLDAMVRQLRSSGIEVNVDPQTYQNGRFARLHDPEGNSIELWEPAAEKRP